MNVTCCLSILLILVDVVLMYLGDFLVFHLVFLVFLFFSHRYVYSFLFFLEVILYFIGYIFPSILFVSCSIILMVSFLGACVIPFSCGVICFVSTHVVFGMQLLFSFFVVLCSLKFPLELSHC